MAASMRIYIASKVRHADKWRALRMLGIPISSTWIDEPDPCTDADALWCRCITEASECTALILYIENEETLKGAFAEVGAALAKGRPIYLVRTDRAYIGLSLFAHPNFIEIGTVEDAIARIFRNMQPVEERT